MKKASILNPLCVGAIEFKEVARISTRIENFEDQETVIVDEVIATSRYFNYTPTVVIV